MGLKRYVSHLDLINYFSRLMVRAEIAMEFTQGFNPKVKFEFGPALPLGVESIAEYFNFYVADDFDSEGLLTRMEAQNMPELRILELHEGEERRLSKTIDGFLFQIELDAELLTLEQRQLIERGDAAEIAALTEVPLECLPKTELFEVEGKLLFDWHTYFVNGRYASPKKLEKYLQTEGVVKGICKQKVFWIEFAV